MFEPMFMSSGGYRFFRISATLYTDSQWFVDELRFVSNGVRYPTQRMGSNTTPAPLVASASSDYGTPYAAWYAFEGDQFPSTGFWASNTGDQFPWLQIDLGPGVLIEPTAVDITIPNLTSGPQNFAILASVTALDASQWTTLMNVGAVSWSPNETRRFVIS